MAARPLYELSIDFPDYVAAAGRPSRCHAGRRRVLYL